MQRGAMQRFSQGSEVPLLRTNIAGTWSQSVGAFSLLPVLIRQLGADSGVVLAEAGLAQDALDDPEGRVAYASLARLLRVSAVRTGCAHFGLLAGRMWRLQDLGLLGELVANGSTVRIALQTLVLHQHLTSGGGVRFLLEREGVVDVGYAVYHPGVTNATQLYDAMLAATFNLLREMCGTQFTPTEVMLSHGAPTDALPFRKLFRIQPRFNAEYCAI